MTALTDLQDAVAANGKKIDKTGADVDAFIAANSGGATDADLQAVTAVVADQGSRIDAIDAKVAPPTA